VFGIDSQFIHVAGIKIPTAALALLPISLPQGNYDEQRRARQLDEMREDLMQAARRTETLRLFKQYVRDLRARKQAERDAERRARAIRRKPRRIASARCRSRRFQSLQRRLFPHHIQQLVHRLRHGAAGERDANRLEDLPRRHTLLLCERAQPSFELLRRPVGVPERREARLERGLVAARILRDLLLCLLVEDDVLRIQPAATWRATSSVVRDGSSRRRSP